MCGIFGIVNFNGDAVSEDSLKKMSLNILWKILNLPIMKMIIG